MFRYVRLRVPHTSPPEYRWVYFSGNTEEDINSQIAELTETTDLELGGGGYTRDNQYTSGETLEQAYNNMQSEATAEFTNIPSSPKATSFGADYSVVNGKPTFKSFAEAGGAIPEGFQSVLGASPPVSAMGGMQEVDPSIETRMQRTGDLFTDDDRALAAGFQRYLTDLFGTGGAPTSGLRNVASGAFRGLRSLYDLQRDITKNPLLNVGTEGIGGFGDFVAGRTGAPFGQEIARELGNTVSLLQNMANNAFTPDMTVYPQVNPYINPETQGQARDATQALRGLVSQLRMPSNIAQSLAGNIDPLALMAGYQNTQNNARSFLEYAANQLGLGGFLQPTIQSGLGLEPFGGGTVANWAINPAAGITR